MASGRPDWYSSVAMHGKHDEDYLMVAVDELGNMLAKMQGLFGAELMTLAVDADGIMKANLSVQDLIPLTVRSIYGAGERETYDAAVLSLDTTELINIAGKGVVYGGSIYLDAGAAQGNDIVELWIDGVQVTFMSFNLLMDHEIYSSVAGFLYLTIWDGTLFKYCVCLCTGITFESSFIIKYTETHGNTPTVKSELYYATV